MYIVKADSCCICLTCIEPLVEIVNCISSLLFIRILNIDVAYKVVANVIAYDHFLNLTKLCQLHEYIFIEQIEVFLKLFWREVGCWIM